ncbi:MAG: DUF1572 family protein [Ferruginibacter sp.]
MQTLESVFLQSAIKRLTYYKELGERTFNQLNEADFHFVPNEESNSIAIIIQHMSGNMLSRWTDFLTTDGEKEWRKRDEEFEDLPASKEQVIALWNDGWDCCLDATRSLTNDDLLKTITIRNEALTVVDAINRQLAHYPYHVGQIIYIGKLIKNHEWENLSMPRNKK